MTSVLKRQEGQNLRAIFGYIFSLRPAWAGYLRPPILEENLFLIHSEIRSTLASSHIRVRRFQLYCWWLTLTTSIRSNRQFAPVTSVLCWQIHVCRCSSGCGGQEPNVLSSISKSEASPSQDREISLLCFRRLKTLSSKVLDDSDDDDLSSDSGSLYEAPLSYPFPKDSTITGQI